MRIARVALLVALLAPGAGAAAESDPAYTALRAARPAGPAIAVQKLTLERDVFRFRFENGAFQFFSPVEGRVTGAVFVGQGSWELRPAIEVERQHLALLTGEPGLEVLSDHFESLVLLFTDETEAEIRRGGKESGAAPAAAAGVFDAYRRHERKDLKINLEIRILQDVLAPTDAKGGVFLAMLDGRKVPRCLAALDPFGLEWLGSGMLTGSEDSALYVIPEADAGFWYLCRRKSELAGRTELPDPLRAEHYEIDSTIRDNTRLSGVTTIRFQAAVPGRRVLPLRLNDRLRIQEASVALAEGAVWLPVAFIQEKEDEDSDAAVVLPRAPAPDETPLLRLRYAGKEILRDMGEGNYAVGARESWYPNFGTFRVLSTFDLTYRVPKGNQVVSVGEQVGDRAEGDLQVSVWKADRPIRVAGFNYGKFRKIEKEDADSGLRIEVYTNPGTPDLVHEINAALQSRSAEAPPSGGSTRGPANENYWGAPAGMKSLNLDTAAFADGAMADGLNAARVGAAYFGPLEEKHVAITQQADWFFGQSWPSLVFLPYLAVLDSTQRHELGLGGTTDFVDLVGPHELAHQWWGHQVGWNSYRDTWLSEGFAEFAASLVMQRVYGTKRCNDYWERSRRWILEKSRTGTVANSQAGPITLGSRLETRQSPVAYEAIVYAKGAYVLQMLRMLMWDPRARPPDAGFIAMMKDFAAAWTGKNPSTRDFQQIVERHMTPTMDLGHDRTMDWFFRQWVDGTEIPRYVVKVNVQAAGSDQYRLTGTVSQEGVSTNFHGFLPLYLEFDKGEVQRLADRHLHGDRGDPHRNDAQAPEEARARRAPTRCTTSWRGTRRPDSTLRPPRLEVALDLPRVLLEVLGVDPEPGLGRCSGPTPCASPRRPRLSRAAAAGVPPCWPARPRPSPAPARPGAAW